MGSDGISDISAGTGEGVDRMVNGSGLTSGSIARLGACEGQRLVLTTSWWRFEGFWKVLYTMNASIFVDVLYWPPYRMDKFISCVVPSPSQWFFHFGKEIVIAWTHIMWVRWLFQNLPLPAAQEVHDSNSVIPCTVTKNDETLYHQMSSFSPKSMRLRSLRQTERTTARDSVHHKRWTYPFYRAVHMEHQQWWVRWWCTTYSKHWQKMRKKGGDYIEGT